MTRAHQVANDDRYKPYLDHGFVGLIGHMGSDESIEFATRMSYGEQTRAISDRVNLLRYIVRNRHTSPIEMGEVQLHMKLPIAIMRQLVRHRTANLNEYSARYSVLTDEFYIPKAERFALQSTTNKQGSGELVSGSEADTMEAIFKESYAHSFKSYSDLLEMGLSRELARLPMPVGGYTEIVWKCDLRNLFGMLRLRLDSHAQEEIRELAQIIYEFTQPLFPILCQAFEDYWVNGAELSCFELAAIRSLLQASPEVLTAALVAAASEKPLSQREQKEFVAKFAAA